MNIEEYRKLQKEYNDKIYKKCKEELREEIKDWSIEQLREKYIQVKLSKVSIASFPWCELFDEREEK